MTAFTKELTDMKERLSVVETKVEDIKETTGDLKKDVRGMRKDQAEQTKMLQTLLHERGMDPKRLNDNDEDPKKIAEERTAVKDKAITRFWVSAGTLITIATTALGWFIRTQFGG